MPLGSVIRTLSRSWGSPCGPEPLLTPSPQGPGMWAHRCPRGGLCRVGGSKTRNIKALLPRPLSRHIRWVVCWTPSGLPPSQGAPRPPDPCSEPVLLCRAGLKGHLGWKCAGEGGRPAPWGPRGSTLSASLHTDLPRSMEGAGLHCGHTSCLQRDTRPSVNAALGARARVVCCGRVRAGLCAVTCPLQELLLVRAEVQPSSPGYPGSSLITLVAELLHPMPRQPPAPHIPCVHNLDSPVLSLGSWPGARWLLGITHFQRQKRGISGFLLHQGHLAPLRGQTGA